jgi:hypothetical protein
METILFKKAIGDIYNFLKREGVNAIVKNQKEVDDGYLRASQVEMVKTIWQIDKPVNLNEFYYPLYIGTRRQKVGFKVEGIASFKDNGKIVLQGIAGQGKSILLRYLAGKALREQEKIPIFIELRKISKTQTLSTLILDCLNSYGIKISFEHFHELIKSPNIFFLFDAFDEVPKECVAETLSSIELIASVYNSLIIVSSRQGAEIQKLAPFEVLELKKLTPKDHKPMLLTLFDKDAKVVDNISSAIAQSDSDLKGLLTTPLILTMLCVTYKGYNNIPRHYHEFYERIFDLLIHRHDATKPGFVRDFLSGLGEHQIEKLFWGFCFFSTLENKESLNQETANNLMTQSMSYYDLVSTEPLKVVVDIYKNTNLILEEGFEYYFIHKSIKEYFSAKFIKESPRELKERFYTSVEYDLYFSNVLGFLSAIDEDDYNRYFLKPKYDDFFEGVGVEDPNLDYNLDFFLDMEIKIDNQKFFIDWGQFGLDSDGTLGFADCFVIVNQFLQKFPILSSDYQAQNYRTCDLPFFDECLMILQDGYMNWIEKTTEDYNKIKKSIDKKSSVIGLMTFPTQQTLF